MVQRKTPRTLDSLGPVQTVAKKASSLVEALSSMHRDECSGRTLDSSHKGGSYSPFQVWAACWLEPLLKVLQVAEVCWCGRLHPWLQVQRSIPPPPLFSSLSTMLTCASLLSSCQNEHKRRLIELCLPRFIKLDRQALYYCTSWLQTHMHDTAALRVLIGLLRHARAHGMIETTGLQAESDGLVSGDSAIVSPQTMEVCARPTVADSKPTFRPLTLSQTAFFTLNLQLALTSPDVQVRLHALAFLCEVRRKKTLPPSAGDLEALQVGLYLCLS